MKNSNVFETLVGAVVLFVAISFALTAYKSGAISEPSGYKLTAKFDRVDGVAVGGEVRMSGLKIGTIKSLSIDPKTYMAVAALAIEDKIDIPSDSSVEIIGDGLLGSKYMAIIPGGEEKMLGGGSEIKYTQSSISIESLIGKFMFSGGNDEKTEGQTGDDDAEEDIF